MAHRALDPVRGAFVAVVAVAGLTLPSAVGFAGDGGASPTFGTRPPRLDRAAIVQIAEAFGIEGEPERIPGGWEAEDDVRALYLTRAPSAWYVHFTNGSLLLGPAGDRDAICSAADPPHGCIVPGVEFVADAAGPAPDAERARTIASETLERTGLLSGDWRSLVLDPGHDQIPCPDDPPTAFPCTRQRVPSRVVVLTRELGADAVAARWTVIMSASGTVLSAVGRVAVPA